MKKRLLIVGGHGSGEIAMSVFEAVNNLTEEWIIEGFLTDILKPNEYLGEYKVVGTTDQIEEFVNKGYYIHNTLHFNAKQKQERVKKTKTLVIPIEANATAIHPLSYIHPSTKIGYGVVTLPFSATSFGSEIKNFIHIYTSGFVGHDSIIEDYATITAHSIIGGRVIVKEGAHIGLNSTIREDIVIGKYAIVGMASVVTKNVEDYTVVVGNPARLISNI